MKFFLNLLMFVTTFGIIILATSCKNDEQESMLPINPDKPVKVKMSLITEDLQTTRTMDENVIKDVNIYLYGKMDYHFYFPTSEALSFEILQGDYEIFVITNAHKDMGIQEKSALQTNVVSYDMMESDIPMVANTNVEIRTSAEPYNLPTIQVKRCAAKIAYDITVDDAVTSNIKLEYMQFCNIPKSVSLFGSISASTNKNDFYDSQIIDINNAKTFSDVFYMFENCQGIIESITDPKDKVSANAPACASYIRIYAQGIDRLVEYIIYLGENTTSDFNIRRNTKHNMNLIIKGENEIDNRVKVYEGLYYGKANCIICTGNRVSFDATPYRTSIKKNYAYSGIYAGKDYDAKSAKVLWQDVKGLIKQVTISNNIVTVSTNGGQGNAVIALYDSTGNITWSFHIWILTEEPSILAFGASKKNPDNLYQALDRDLGATERVGSAQEYKGRGLAYQFGRKDPFPAYDQAKKSGVTIYDISGNTLAIKSMFATVKDEQFDICGSIEYATAHPLMYLTMSEGHWLQTGEDKRYLWGNPEGIMTMPSDNYPDNTAITKSIYDPCPEGYKVAPGDAFLSLYNQYYFYDINETLQMFYRGQTWGRNQAGICSGSVANVGPGGCWVSSLFTSYNCAYINQWSSGVCFSAFNDMCVSTGVRCVKE